MLHGDTVPPRVSWPADFSTQSRIIRTMMTFGVPAALLQPVLARGRGIGYLIKGLFEGDPIAIGITAVAVVCVVGYVVYQRVSGSIDE